MSRIKWDQIGERKFKTGVDRGVLYPQVNGAYPEGVPWNGLTNITMTPSGAEDNALYADNMKYLNLKSAEELGLTIECYFYPDEWAQCNGEAALVEGVMLGQQARKPFGLAFRNRLGNDTAGDDYGYEIHLVYGCSASPSEQSNATVNDSPEAATFSYDVTTTPIAIESTDEDGKQFRPVASVTIDSTKVAPEKLAALEEIIYGKDGTGDTDTGTVARLPLPDELKTIFAAG